MVFYYSSQLKKNDISTHAPIYYWFVLLRQIGKGYLQNWMQPGATDAEQSPDSRSSCCLLQQLVGSVLLQRYCQSWWSSRQDSSTHSSVVNFFPLDPPSQHCLLHSLHMFCLLFCLSVHQLVAHLPICGKGEWFKTHALLNLGLYRILMGTWYPSFRD